MADDTQPLGIGLVGAGAFGEFCLAAFAELKEVRIAAVGDTDFARAQTLAACYNAAAYPTLDLLLADPNVSIVALNTPPYLHAPQGLAALNAGKHLFCEKPLALTVADGEEMIQVARKRGLQLTVDYVMRHNMSWATAATLARSGVLGKLRHMDLANHANGLSLPATHWFWDESKSGGIWIEHGVHFFDAFGWVSGQPGKVSSAVAYKRADGKIDRVEGLFYYGDVAAHCYHAFDQSGQTEQTTVRLTFERGYVTLREWVPTALELQTAVPRADWECLLPPVEYSQLPDGQLLAKASASEGKAVLYRQSIQAGMRQLANAIREGSPLVVTGENGLESLRTAVAASGW
ncbi:MAG: Gfo/Idh/MocA family protein [Aggregatilineales bacterium]